MRADPSNRTVTFRGVREGDASTVIGIMKRDGEGKVDIRAHEEMRRVIRDRAMHVFVSEEGKIVGFGAAYSYCGTCLIELGSSVWLPEWRGLGGADMSVVLRTILACLTNPGSTCVSELYLDSVASAKVLSRNGFLEVTPTPKMEEHALAASSRPVRHFALPPSELPSVASRALAMIDGRYENRGRPTLRLRLGADVLLRQPSGRAAMEALADGDLSVAGWGNIGRRSGDSATWLSHDGC